MIINLKISSGNEIIFKSISTKWIHPIDKKTNDIFSVLYKQVTLNKWSMISHWSTEVIYIFPDLMFHFISYNDLDLFKLLIGTLIRSASIGLILIEKRVGDEFFI
jgi:hypothetical protein